MGPNESINLLKKYDKIFPKDRVNYLKNLQCVDNEELMEFFLNNFNKNMIQSLEA